MSCREACSPSTDDCSAVDRAEFAVFAKLLAGYKPAKDPIHDLHKSRGDDDY